MPDFSTAQLVERTYDHLNTYITVADQKASILLTGQFAFLGLAATASSDILKGTDWIFDLLAGMTAVFGVVAMVFSIAVIYPRTPSSGESVIYWGDIRNRENSQQYRDDIEELEGTDSLDALVNQNYELAAVAKMKYCLLRWSLRVTIAMIGAAAVATLRYFLL